LGTAGLVYISYVGVTSIASVAEEVKNPEKNLPLGMLLAFGTALLVYGLGTYIMVGILPMEQLKTSLTPVADVAEHMGGLWAKILVTIAAVFAFSSVTNAGILSASRYPMAMSRDHLLPKIFRTLSAQKIPVYSVIATVGLILVFILFLNPLKIAKLASAFQLLMFAFCCLAVVIMRESHIEAYDPGFHAPFYPWLQIVGIIVPFWFIQEMGSTSILFSAGLVIVGIIWYYQYARSRVERRGAILHVFERLGQHRHEGLEPELRGILKEKGLREHDPFDILIAQASVVELDNEERFDTIIEQASKVLGEQLSYPAEKIEKEILDGTKVGGTPISHGVALPHMRLHNIVEPELLIIRAKKGIRVDLGQAFWGDHAPTKPIYAIFLLISPEENPRQHLRILAKLAARVDDAHFMEEWMAAKNEQELKEILLRDDHFVAFVLHSGTKAAKLIGKLVREIDLPEETLIAIIHRDGKTIVPRGHKTLKEGDRLTIIGDQKGIADFRQRYG